MDMVRSMMNYIIVPLSLWMYALKSAAYLLNRVPSKVVPKTPYKLWTRRKVYNPHEKKLDARSISGFFIGYPKKLKGYIFSCPNHSMRIVESGNAWFIENDQFSGSGKS
ncbi:hypothetical protein CR513_49605, partial [Mucuna pruriens]